MRRSSLLLGIDLGTGSLKVVVVDLVGRVIGSGLAEYPIERPAIGWAEQSPDAWWDALIAASRGALSQADGAETDVRARIAAIGLSGQMHGTVLIGPDHAPLAPAVIWPDQRGGADATAITEAVGANCLIALTGGPLATGFQAATLRWLARHRSDVLARAAWILCPKDALRLRLTGQVATDPSDAAGTGLLDSAHRVWSPVLAAAASVDIARLPPIQSPSSIAGPLRGEAAAALGLVAGTPVVTGAADTAAGLAGAGLLRPGSFLLTISSGGQLVQPVADAAPDPTGHSHTFCSALPPDGGLAGWYRLAAILSAGLALRWLRDAVLGLEGANAYDRMLAWIDEVPIGSRGLVFLPYLAGERNPHLDPAARGAFIGLTAAHGRAELVRALIEGITLACLDAAEAMWAAGGRPASIVAAGGGARSPAWRQIIADAFGLPVRHLGTGDQAALGAALLAGSGTRLLDLVPAAEAWARLGPPVEPDPRRHAAFTELFDVYRDGYPSMRGMFARLRVIGGSDAGPD